MKLALIPPGEFLMGSPDNEICRNYDEYQHRVRITKPF
jgi:formylglycine-generating enzyme required for sulfatase activity